MEDLTFDQLPNAVIMLTNEVSELKHLLIEKQLQTPTDQPEKLLTIDDVAELLHLTKPTIYIKHSKGDLPGVSKRSKSLYFQHDVIITWLKAGHKKSTVEIDSEAETYLFNNKKG